MCGLVDMCVTHVPSPQAHAPTKVQHVYTGPTDSVLAQDMAKCDPDVSILILISTVAIFDVSDVIIINFYDGIIFCMYDRNSPIYFNRNFHKKYCS